MPLRPVSNPPNPWHGSHVEYLGEAAPNATLEVYEEEARSILAENDSPDLGFRWSANPYRGCFHACAYCYARPSHQYLGFGAGTDFDRRIVVKTNAPSLLREAFERRSWTGELVLLSGNTDCYQPLEASYELTRGLLEACRDYRNPVGVITKGALVRRDAALLDEINRVARATVSISIPFADDATGRKIEPSASTTTARFEAMRALCDAGVSVGINVAPVIPGLNDRDVPELLERAHAAGATRASLIPVRLSAEVLPIFRERIREVLSPSEVRKIEHGIEEMRGGGGRMNDSSFGARMTGVGARWAATEALFDAHVKRLGLNAGADGGDRWATVPATFRRPTAQRSLFEE